MKNDAVKEHGKYRTEKGGNLLIRPKLFSVGFKFLDAIASLAS